LNGAAAEVMGYVDYMEQSLSARGDRTLPGAPMKPNRDRQGAETQGITVGRRPLPDGRGSDSKREHV
jgi:hypothetical protein